ncbi:MAG TPA: hypothetical protein VMV27_15690 [Candidatus Binataceae bacterium]|nr:hypothetical protein [Candidatus Binataceae bacterium]
MHERLHIWRRGLPAFAAAIMILATPLAGRASGADIGAVIDNQPAAAVNIQVIYVKDLAKLMADPNSHVRIYDANPPSVRRSEGMIPGARPLTSSDKYNVADELPTARSAKLVFYCHNPQ